MRRLLCWGVLGLMSLGCTAGCRPVTQPVMQPAIQKVTVGERAGEQRTYHELRMKFCWCPPGEFQMGSPKDESWRGDEGQVAVTLTQGFWMGKYEVTQAQYQRVMGANPSVYQGPSLPVDSVSWEDAEEFCQKLTDQDRAAGRLEDGWEYRLPTEAQWEYACRAGSTTAYSFGDDATRLGDYAWYGRNSGENQGQVGSHVHPVGQKQPNAWGLHDMYGNVSEWCRDCYQQTLPGGTDPEVARLLDAERVHRGGSWNLPSGNCRSSIRTMGRAGLPEPAYRNSLLGFRVALVPPSLSSG